MGTPVHSYGDQSAGPAPNVEALPNPWGTPAPVSSPAPVSTLGAANTEGATGTANPFATMFQEARPPQQAGDNPMGGMMQMMMTDPAMMQQSMAMMNQMFGGANQAPPLVAPALTPTNPALAPTMPTLPTVPTGTPAVPPAAPPAPVPPVNPFLQMMNLAGLHQPGGFPTQNPAGMNPFFAMNAASAVPPVPVAAPVPNLASNPIMLQAARTRFQAQLGQLSGMGFTNETVCLQALVQHNGRIDTVIDMLLSNSNNADENST